MAALASGIASPEPATEAAPDAPPVSPEVARALADAERHFQTGKAFAIEGRADRARGEFDSALSALFNVPEGTPDRAAAERRFEELIRLIHRYDVENLGSGQPVNSPIYVESPLPQILGLSFPVNPGLKTRTLEQVRGSKSQLPLTVNDAVLTYINYFTSTKGQRVLLYGLKRAGRYRPMIQRVLDEEGVPQELIHLAQAESAFMPTAVSRKSATGMWQFVQWRGNQYGLTQSKYYDYRLEPEKATRAAARHLRDLFDQFGDWYLAMAAYNCGPGCVDRAVQRTGYADFWQLRSRGVLPRETANYVPAILAMAIVCKDLSAYGIPEPDPDPELEYDVVTITADTNLALVADAADRPVADIRELNPFLLKGVAPAGSEIKVPKGAGSRVLAALDGIPAANRLAWRLHRIERGDTLAAIAKRYSTAANSIMAANDQLNADFFAAPVAGEMILIPASLRPEPAPRLTSRSGSRSKVQTVRTNSRTRRAAVKIASAGTHSRTVNR